MCKSSAKTVHDVLLFLLLSCARAPQYLLCLLWPKGHLVAASLALRTATQLHTCHTASKTFLRVVESLHQTVAQPTHCVWSCPPKHSVMHSRHHCRLTLHCQVLHSPGHADASVGFSNKLGIVTDGQNAQVCPRVECESKILPKYPNSIIWSGDSSPGKQVSILRQVKDSACGMLHLFSRTTKQRPNHAYCVGKSQKSS